jgi:hypothetical protein
MGGFIHAGTMWRWMDEVEDVVLRRDLLEDVKVTGQVTWSWMHITLRFSQHGQLLRRNA